jgi:V/A-type H+-transporting ATPase subunit I
MLGGAAILFAVHVLNILLGSLAVLVHGVRLNALEFSSHMGIQWLGLKFNPFRKQTPT